MPSRGFIAWKLKAACWCMEFRQGSGPSCPLGRHMHMQDQRSWKCAKRLTFAAFLTVFSFNLPVIGQGQMPEHSHGQQQNKPEQKQEQTQPEQQMPGKEHGQHKGMPMHEHATMQAGHRAAAEPASTPVPMLTTMRGKWMLMLHGVAFLNSLQQR